MPTEVITISSLLIALTALGLTLWQNMLQRRALQAQVFLHMLDQFGSEYVSNGSACLTRLQHYDDFEAFESGETAETRSQIYKLVEFLNDTARLVMTGYLPRQSVWDIYFMVYRTAYEKLSPWWLEGQRGRSYKQKFIAFEEMCLQIAAINPKQMAAFDAKEYPHFHQKYRSSR
jgi:hypothetical protein